VLFIKSLQDSTGARNATQVEAPPMVNLMNGSKKNPAAVVALCARRSSSRFWRPLPA
jgi:hypothetical protein